jgi:hypothetical protein
MSAHQEIMQKAQAVIDERNKLVYDLRVAVAALDLFKHKQKCWCVPMGGEHTSACKLAEYATAQADKYKTRIV